MQASRVFHARPIAALYDLLTGQDFWRAEIEAMVAPLAAAWADRPGRMLDLGCGPGESAFVLADRFPRAEVLGVDIAPAMIRRAERQRLARRPRFENLRFEVADATALPLADHSIDLAIGHSFLYMVPDRAGVLRETMRVLAPGGELRLMEPAKDASLRLAARRSRPAMGRAVRRAPVAASRFAASMLLWRCFSRTAGQLSPAGVRDLFGAAGFTAIEVRDTLGGLGLHCIGRRPAVTG